VRIIDKVLEKIKDEIEKQMILYISSIFLSGYKGWWRWQAK
jgi:hypothetical protein